MSTESKKYRADMRAKANRLANSKSPTKVDASSWSPSDALNADRKTGARPLRARIYKAGGRVQGDRGPVNAGKAPRKNGGGALSMTNVADENKKAKGSFHEGGYRKGGKTACGGGRMAKGGKAGDKPAIDPMMSLRTKRTEVLEPRKGAMEELARRQSGDKMETRPAGVTLHNKGGKVDDDKQDKKEIKTAIHKHDKQMHGGTLTKGLRKGGETDSTGGRVERAKGGGADDKPRLRLVKTHSEGNKTAKVYKDADWNEYRVKNYVDGQYRDKADYHTDDVDDAHDTAKAFLRDGKATGGRAARAKGGRTKGKTNINIIIGQPGGAPQQPNMPPPQAPVRPPPPPMNASPPPMGGPPMGAPPPGGPPGPPPGLPPGGPPGMPPGMRAAGGRVAGYRSKDAGAGSGLGRLRKVHKEGQHTPGFKGA